MSITDDSQVQRSEELRLALVMNGGVSLAVWIGGVAYEINRFVAETHPVYQQLLELTQTRACVDVISGTSAGGVNGAALALACVYDASLSSLRELWLSKSSFADLLQDPGKANPSSLLKGEDYFLPALKDAFQNLVKDNKQVSPPMDLSLTATMLRGEPHSHLDDLGEDIKDVHHRAVFHYESSPDHPFNKLTIADDLASAARASASFPVAFEPCFFEKNKFENAATGKPGKFSHYLIDGGVLDNKPLRGALRAIFKMRPSGGVRRVLAYVVPDPSVTALTTGDKKKQPPPIIEVAMSSLLAIPAAQSIADELKEIDEHNKSVRQRRHTIAWLASNITSPNDLETMAKSLFGAYRKRRIDGFLDFVLEQVEAALVDVDQLKQDANATEQQQQNEVSVTTFGRHTRSWLKALWMSEDEAKVNADAAWKGFIPTVYQDLEDVNFSDKEPSEWLFGLYSIEFAAGIMLDLLRRTQRLSHLKKYGLKAAEEQAPPIPESLPPKISNADSSGWDLSENSINWDTFDWDLLDTVKRNRRNERTQTEPTNAKEVLPWEGAANILAKIRQARAEDAMLIKNDAADKLLTILWPPKTAAVNTASEIETRIVDWLKGCLKPTHPLQPPATPTQRNAELASEIAQVLLTLNKFMQEVSEAVKEKDKLRRDERMAYDELGRLYQLFFKDKPSADKLMRRLLQLEIVHYSMAGKSEKEDAIVELVQISARGKSPWGGSDTPEGKLTGMQMEHFGAFYRKSWRANDWMTGRLDGVSRIVRIALNPDRLHRLYAGRNILAAGKSLQASEYVLGFVKALAIDSAAPAHLELLKPYWNRQALLNELAFLDNTDSRIPETLPECAEALIRRLHLEVICKELPKVASCAQDDKLNGTGLGKQGKYLVQKVRDDLSQPKSIAINHFINIMFMEGNPRNMLRRKLFEWLTLPNPSRLMEPKAATEAFNDYPIGKEDIDQEVGEDLMTHTAGEALAVTHAALTGKHSGLGGVGSSLKILTLPVRLFLFLTKLLTQDSRTSAVLVTTVFTSGFLFVLGAVWFNKPPAWLAPVGWSMLIGWLGAVSLRRSKLIVLFFLGMLAAILVWTKSGGSQLFLYALIALTVVSFLPTWVGATLSALAAMWWTSGQPELADIGAGVCTFLPAWTHCKIVEVAANATTFVNMLGPVIVVGILAIIAYFGSRQNH